MPLPSILITRGLRRIIAIAAGSREATEGDLLAVPGRCRVGGMRVAASDPGAVIREPLHRAGFEIAHRKIAAYRVDEDIQSAVRGDTARQALERRSRYTSRVMSWATTPSPPRARPSAASRACAVRAASA